MRNKAKFAVFIGTLVLVWAASMVYQHFYYNTSVPLNADVKHYTFSAAIEHVVVPTEAQVATYQPEPTPDARYTKGNNNSIVEYILGCEISCP